MSFESFWSDVIATVAGGIALTILFFVAKEKWFSLPNIIGRWYMQQETQGTSYNPYKGMILRYVVMIWREGRKVEGTAEKIHEISSTGERPFVGKDRTRARISGYVEKRYLGRSQVYLHVVEESHERESSHFYSLKWFRLDTMVGTFTSMVADQYGTVKWQRNPF